MTGRTTWFTVPAGLPAGRWWPAVALAAMAIIAIQAEPWLLPVFGLFAFLSSGSVRQALRVGPDPRGWQWQGPEGWQAVRLQRVTEQAGRLVLDLRIADVTNSNITCTVWRENMEPDHWRQLRIHARRGECLAVFPRGAS